jgi:cellulose biosynthesis protein BcsQ
VGNNKSGVGKTTSAVNLSAGIAAGSLNPEAPEFDKTVRDLFPVLEA